MSSCTLFRSYSAWKCVTPRQKEMSPIVVVAKPTPAPAQASPYHNWGGIFSHSVYMYLTWGPVTWGPDNRGPVTWSWPYAEINNAVSYSYEHHNRWLNAIGQKKAPSHSLAITRDTHNRDREKSSGQANLFNIWNILTIHGQNLSSSSGQHEFVAQYKFFEILASGFLGQLVCGWQSDVCI